MDEGMLDAAARLGAADGALAVRREPYEVAEAVGLVYPFEGSVEDALEHVLNVESLADLYLSQWEVADRHGGVGDPVGA